MKLRNLSNLFLYELWTLCDAKTRVTAVLLHMSRLASNCDLVQELKAQSDQAKEHMYLVKTIISSYQAIPPVKNDPAIKGLIASSQALIARCCANASSLDTALICTSLDILFYELAKLERLRLYANLLSDRHTVTILNSVLDDSIEAKRRLAKLMCLCVDLDSVSAPKSMRAPDGTPSYSARPETVSKVRKTAKSRGYRKEESRLGEIEHVQAADNTVDEVTKNARCCAEK
jgi:ferritin-like metal-binding protein YciE